MADGTLNVYGVVTRSVQAARSAAGGLGMSGEGGNYDIFDQAVAGTGSFSGMVSKRFTGSRTCRGAANFSGGPTEWWKEILYYGVRNP